MQTNTTNDLPKNLIFVTYKGKILLTSNDSFINLHEKNVWSLPDISRTREFGWTKDTITSIDKQLHFIKLTDNNVFSIRRQDGRRLEFYSPSEMSSLLLTSPTQELYLRYEEKIKKILAGVI